MGTENMTPILWHLNLGKINNKLIKEGNNISYE
jgi:hypothetical protein